MIFDQYSRYKACSDLLRKTGFLSGNTVLDIGSGPECLFGQFMPDAKMTYVDPLISGGSGEERISGNVFAPELDGQSFDCVSAVDVLEHVPPEHRHAFLERLASLGRNALILGFPAADATDALNTDNALEEMYHPIFGHDYSWLEEHHRLGLPSLAETVEQLNRLGWHCQTVGHGHAPWLRELLGFVICAWELPDMKELVLEISEKFNRDLYSYDFRSPYYRQFVIATRSPLPPIGAPAGTVNTDVAEAAFRALMQETHRKYFALSMRKLVNLEGIAAERDAATAERDVALAERDTALTEGDMALATCDTVLVKRYEELAERYGNLAERYGAIAERNSGLAERDARIDALTKKIDDFTYWVEFQHEKDTALEQALSDKHAELMKMSDWAQGMMRELDRRNASIFYRAGAIARRSKSLIRNRLAPTFLGNFVRQVKDGRRYREKRLSLEAIRQSVSDNHGRLIITFPIITWDFRWQRPQHIVSRLRDRGFSVFYIAMSLAPLGRRLRNNKEALAQIGFNELAQHVNQIWLNSGKQVNIYSDALEGDDLHNVEMQIDALISELRPQSIIYLVQFPGWGPVAQNLRNRLGGKIIFDCMDDHSGFSTNTAAALKVEEKLMKHADLVITSSRLLEERAKSINRNTIQVKNGTEFDHFSKPVCNGLLDHLQDRPIIGYYGAISDWFDMRLVAHCASQRPDWNFVLIGATTGADLKPVADLKNVYLLGEKPYKDLPGYLAHFDVCTIPFKIVPLTLATNPVKFYEYLSAGKPVVAVELPELLAYQEDCYLARSSDEFMAQLERALNEREDENKIERRLNLARENSWDARVGAILDSEIFKTYLQT